MTVTSQPFTTTETTAGSPTSRSDIAAGGLLPGCLQALVAANAVQVGAAFASVDPSPPSELVPFIAATAVIGLASLAWVRAGLRVGYWLGVLFCLVSMIGMGPHKLLMDDGGVIAPLALAGFAFEVVFLLGAFRYLRATPGRPRRTAPQSR